MKFSSLWSQSRVLWLAGMIGLGIGWPGCGRAEENSSMALSAAERYVTNEVAHGRTATLPDPKDPEANRVLSVMFLQELLTGKTYPVHRHGVRITNAVVTESVDLANAQVVHEVVLRNCEFRADVNLERSWFQHSVQFQYCTFGDSLSLSDARIDGNLSVVSTTNNAEAYFTRLNVAGNVWLGRSVFTDKVDFAHAQFKRNLECDDVRFLNPDVWINFGDLGVGGAVVMRRARFAGPVSFRHADIGDNLRAEQARFEATGLSMTNDFGDLKVAASVLLMRALFYGQTNFEKAQVGGDFVADGIKCFERASAGFYRLRVAGTGFFKGAAFSGPVDFRDAGFGSLDFSDVAWPAAQAGPNADILESVIQLQGLRYQRITAQREVHDIFRNDWRMLLDLAGRAQYAPDIYTTMEESFRREGLSYQANMVSIAQQRRERDMLKPNRNVLRLAAQTLTGTTGSLHNLWEGVRYWLMFPWDWFTGFGRRLWLGLVWSVGCILLGWCMFADRNAMQSLDEKKFPIKDYGPRHAFWYSVACFSPYFHLDDSDKWIPKPDRKYRRNYRRIHMILGHLLIPIGLAALTGIIK